MQLKSTFTRAARAASLLAASVALPAALALSALATPPVVKVEPNSKTVVKTEGVTVTTGAEGAAVTPPAAAVAAGATININTATAEELVKAKLKGIGKARAEAIVKDRAANGPFSSVQDLTRVKGIGKKTIEHNGARLTVGQ